MSRSVAGSEGRPDLVISFLSKESLDKNQVCISEPFRSNSPDGAR
jgi:hypothetical protein